MINIDLKLVEKHMMDLRRLTAASCKRYLACIAEFVDYRRQNAQDGDMSKITGQDITDYLAWCASRGNGNQRRRFKLSALQAFFFVLTHVGIIASDPTADIRRPKPNNDLTHFFTRGEILKMFTGFHVSIEKDIRDAVFLIMGAMAGLRVSEITGFNIDHAADDGKCIVLRIVNTRDGGDRSVSLWQDPSSVVRMLLRARLAQVAGKGDPLLTSYRKDGRPRGNRRLTHVACERLLKNLANHAGIRKPVITPTALRTTHIRDLQQIVGYDTPEIKKRLGWVQLNSAARYFELGNKVRRRYIGLREYWADFKSVPIVESCRSRRISR